MIQYWNYLLTGLDIIGFYFLWAVGKKKAFAWLWPMLTQAIWIFYSINTAQWGFLLGALIKFAIYSHHWVKWHKEERGESAPAEPQVVAT
jgi:hypothetical protein